MELKENMQSFLEGIKDKIPVVKSFDEVKGNSIVFATNDGEEGFDIYLCDIQDGALGEFVSWVYEEFQEEETLIDIIQSLLKSIAEFEGDFDSYFIETSSPIHFTAY